MPDKLAVNPWMDIWLEPKKTIRAIVNFNPKFHFILLSMIYGLPMAFNLAQNYSMIEIIPVWAIVISSLVLCGFIGALAITVTTWILNWTGKLIGGKGSFQTVRSAVAWASVPSAVTIVMWGVLLAVFGSDVFHLSFAETMFVGYQAGVIFLVFLIESIVSIWAFIILLKMLAEVQGFSTWKALLNVIIPFVLLVVILWGLGWVFSGPDVITK